MLLLTWEIHVFLKQTNNKKKPGNFSFHNAKTEPEEV